MAGNRRMLLRREEPEEAVPLHRISTRTFLSNDESLVCGILASLAMPPFFEKLTFMAYPLHDNFRNATIGNMLRWLALTVGAIALGHGHLMTSGLLFAAGGFLCYWLSLHRHPFRTCRRCGGTGRHQGLMFPWSFRACTNCGGQSRHRRWGVQLFHSSPDTKQTWAERRAKEAGGRRGAPR